MELVPLMLIFILVFAVISMICMAVDDCSTNKNLLYIIAGFGYGSLLIAFIAGIALLFI